MAKITTVSIDVVLGHDLRVYAAMSDLDICVVVERAVREYMAAHPVS